MIKEKITELIKKAVLELGVNNKDIPLFTLEHPDVMSHGDYATNIALILSKQLKKSPVEVAKQILEKINENKIEEIEKVETAGPGFINFYLSAKYFNEGVEEIIEKGENYGQKVQSIWSRLLNKNQVMIEYTDPNPFKQFHIGHLMSNAIGESISRLIAFNGASVIRACYSGDVGLHVAKAIWGYRTLEKYLSEKKEKVFLYDQEKKILSHDDEIAFWGMAYAFGASEYDNSESHKGEIDILNKEIFFSPTLETQKLYDQGKEISLKHFDDIYKKLGTHFDQFFFESEVVTKGLALVSKGLKDGVFEQSEKAVVFHGEKYDPTLHTRVFINSFGVPTYETKELALNEKKFGLYKNISKSIIITASEQSEYFRVVLKALSIINPLTAEKTKHISHGMLGLTSGKMSSRKGNIITGESLLSDVEEKVAEKMKDRDIVENKKKQIIEIIAVGALKFSILKQEAGSNIIFDFDKSLSFEGDSGPYLQYAAVRARSILGKAKDEGIKADIYSGKQIETGDLSKLLIRFPEVVERAGKEYAPHYLATYLIELASVFSTFYAQEKVVDKADPKSPYRVALTHAFLTVMENGLNLLGIKVPDKM